MSDMPSADDRREAADEARVEADVERVDADTHRVEADTDRRDQADTDRIDADGVRNEADTNRGGADTDRTDADTIRDQADTVRGEADAAREAGDVLRTEQDVIRQENHELQKPSPEPRLEKHFASFVERVIIVSLVIFLLVSLFGSIGSWYVYRAILDNREATYEGRAVACRLLVTHDLPVTDGGPCDDPEVLKHYNPNERSPQGP